ncbi:FixG Ig-like domain-containing protein, partial [Nanoarchaeota archaeon]
DLDIDVWFMVDEDMSDVKVEVELSYGSKDVEVSTSVRDRVEDVMYKESLDLRVPSNMDVTPTGETYTLTIRIRDGSGTNLAVIEVPVFVQRENDLLEIQKVLGSSTGEAGKPLTWTVVVKNIGSDEQEDVYVKVTSPELGLSVEERAGDIEATDDDEDEDVATVGVPLRIPADAVEGTYTLFVKVYNDDVESTSTKTLQVSGTKKAADSTEVVPVEQNLVLKQGKAGTYELTLLNLGNSAQTYTLSVSGLDGWATHQVNPLSVKLNPQASQVVNVGLTVSENALMGQHAFNVKVFSDGKEVKDLTLTTQVEGASKEVNTMLISVVVLAIVLLVLLVLLVKLRKADDELEESEESYY